MSFLLLLLTYYVDFVCYLINNWLNLGQLLNKWGGVLNNNISVFFIYNHWNFWRHWDEWTHTFFRRLVYIAIAGTIFFYCFLCYILLGYIPAPYEL